MTYSFIQIAKAEYKTWTFTLWLSMIFDFQFKVGPSWPWSYSSWIYNYQYNQCLSPLMSSNLDQGEVYNIMW